MEQKKSLTKATISTVRFINSLF